MIFSIKGSTGQRDISEKTINSDVRMNNFFSKKKEVESDRDKQIRELREAYPNARKPFKDDTAFDIVFKAGSLVCTLKIYLNGDFPNVKPS